MAISFLSRDRREEVYAQAVATNLIPCLYIKLSNFCPRITVTHASSGKFTVDNVNHWIF